MDNYLLKTTLFMDGSLDCNLLKESFSEMSLMFVSKAMVFFVGQQFSEVALLLMKLINGVLKEGRYKKTGRTLDKICRDSNWGEMVFCYQNCSDLL